ncbi:MAG: fructose-bisphosphate aldolase, partial [Chromatiales bacterium]|nr:fructose-bisphosphate aldolase [Chromatiales bacterium]
PKKIAPEQIAEHTLRCLSDTVPASVPGIAFLSGGQGDEDATVNLNAINVLARTMRLPWTLTFSYARALQNQAMKTWAGNPATLEAARRQFLHRARCNSAASRGAYRPEMEQEKAA